MRARVACIALLAEVVAVASAACSLKSCKELGWGNVDKDGHYVDKWPLSSALVCGESDFGMEGCSGTLSQASAAAICSRAGARLCTSAELLADETRGTGCNLDEKYIWTSEACGADKFFAAWGSSLGGASKKQCLSKAAASVASARCCADVAD